MRISMGKSRKGLKSGWVKSGWKRASNAIQDVAKVCWGWQRAHRAGWFHKWFGPSPPPGLREMLNQSHHWKHFNIWIGLSSNAEMSNSSIKTNLSAQLPCLIPFFFLPQPSILLDPVSDVSGSFSRWAASTGKARVARSSSDHQQWSLSGSISGPLSLSLLIFHFHLFLFSFPNNRCISRS